MSHSTLILTGADVRRLLDPTACLEAVEQAFRRHGQGLAGNPAVASVPVAGGGFHVKAGVLDVGGGSYFVSKTNANFPENRVARDLPTIQGTLVIHDARSGAPLAVMDSIEITALRTAAATGVAARHLARHDATTLAIIGCGLQGERHARLLPLVRQITRAVVFDASVVAARRLASMIETDLRIPSAVASSPAEATREADICVTCTTSREFLLNASHVSAGAFVAGVGVDNEDKKELAPDLLARARVVVDVTGQCAAFGDLHHAIDAGVMTPADVHAELGSVVAGVRPGRESGADIIVFDSTGMALQDAAAAAMVFERARAAGAGIAVDFPA
jgi:ornithine cyclodeaminase/alanine dehydrogenase-like protein (mu-crystallin family)